MDPAVAPDTAPDEGTRHASIPPRIARLITVCTAGLAVVFALAAAAGATSVLPWADAWLALALVIVPGAVAAVLAGSLLAPLSLRGGILATTVSMLLGLYVLEGAIRLLPPPPSGEAWLEEQQRAVAEREGHPFDHRDPEQLLSDLRARGIDAWPTIPAPQLLGEPYRGETLEVTVDGRRLVPLAGVSDARIDHCRESGRYPAQRTDRYGFNNPPGLWAKPVEIALVGDSFVHGMCTEADASIAAMMRATVPATLSVGIGGWGPLFELGAIKDYVAEVRPRHVFWMYYEGNDLVDLRRDQSAPVLPEYLSPGFEQGLVELRDSIDAGLKAFLERVVAARSGSDGEAVGAPAGRTWMQELRSFLRLRDLRALAALTDLDGQRSALTAVEDLEAVLVEAKAVVESWGGRLHFVYLPRYARYEGVFARLGLPHLRARSRVLDMVGRLELPIVDLHADFLGSGDPRELFFHPESHYDEDGNRVVAHALLRSLGLQP